MIDSTVDRHLSDGTAPSGDSPVLTTLDQTPPKDGQTEFDLASLPIDGKPPQCYVFVCRSARGSHISAWQQIKLILDGNYNRISVRRFEHNFVIIMAWLHEQEIDYTLFVQEKTFYTNIRITIIRTSLYVRLSSSDAVYLKIAFPFLNDIFAYLPDREIFPIASLFP